VQLKCYILVICFPLLRFDWRPKCRKHGDEIYRKIPNSGLDIGVVIWSRGRCVTAWLGSGAGSVEQVEAGVRLRGDGEQIETSRSKRPDSVRQNGCIQEGSIKTLLE